MQNNVSRAKNWAAVRKSGEHAVVEAITEPGNNADEWKLIQWSGAAGEAVPNLAKRRNYRSLSVLPSEAAEADFEQGHHRGEALSPR